MSKTMIFGIDKEFLSEAAEVMLSQHKDSVMVLAPMAGSMSTHAPAKTGKYKDYFRIKSEIWIPKDAIKGDEALNGFGVFAVMRLPKARVQDHLLKEEN